MSNQYFNNYMGSSSSSSSSSRSGTSSGTNNSYYSNSDYAKNLSTESKINKFHSHVRSDVRRAEQNSVFQIQTQPQVQPPVQIHHVIFAQSQPQTTSQPQPHITIVLPSQYHFNSHFP